ncbi:MAG: hypothetical protein HYZ28_10280, partial [Myxococcales bacterium]|nr:hypothetical protein [Myxococcales bacterium]
LCQSNGQMSLCQICDDTQLVSCTTACGSPGTQGCTIGCELTGRCTGAEVCNGCDDDGDGVADEGLFRCGSGPFQQLDCVGAVDIDYKFSSSDRENGFDRDPNNHDQYANNIDFHWTIVTNRFIRTLVLEFQRFQTVEGDRLLIVGPGGFSERIEGVPPMVPLGSHRYPLNGEGQRSPLGLRFSTDGNKTSSGFGIQRAALSCGAAGPLVAPRVPPMERVEGFLLGTGDTVFLELDGSFAYTYLVLDGFPEDADFDMYVRRGALPERDRFDYRSVNETSATNANDEALRVSDNTSGQRLLVAITSEKGAGWFHFSYSRALPREVRRLTAGTNVFVSPAQLEAMRSALEEAQRIYFTASEGQLVIERIDLHHSGPGANACKCGGTACDICFVDRAGDRSDALKIGLPPCNLAGAPPGNGVRLSIGNWFDPGTIAHELGHCPGGFKDEYAWFGHVVNGEECHPGVFDGFCASSMHGGLDRFTLATGYCTGLNHGQDLIVAGDQANHVCKLPPCGNVRACFELCAFCTPADSQFAQLESAGRLVDTVTLTPDHRTLRDFTGFGDLVRAVLQ